MVAEELAESWPCRETCIDFSFNPVRLRPSPIDLVAATRRHDHRATDGKATAGTGALGQIGKETVEGG
jgi:hypothetical protein